MGKPKGSGPTPGSFKKGQSGNPGGRPKIPEDIKALLHDRSNEYKRKFLYWCDAPKDQAHHCVGAPWVITSMDRMICSSIVQAMNGNYKAFTAILDRILGRVSQAVELSGPDGKPIEHNHYLAEFSEEEIIAMATKVLETKAAELKQTKGKTP